jgi:hypothetical protein
VSPGPSSLLLKIVFTLLLKQLSFIDQHLSYLVDILDGPITLGGVKVFDAQNQVLHFKAYSSLRPRSRDLEVDPETTSGVMDHWAKVEVADAQNRFLHFCSYNRN